MKLQQFTAAEQELDAFGNMDKPDLFFGYYPDLYPGRQGDFHKTSISLSSVQLPGTNPSMHNRGSDLQVGEYTETPVHRPCTAKDRQSLARFLTNFF